MSRTRAHTTAIDVQPDDLQRLTAYIDTALEQAQTEGARTPAVLREIILRPLAKKIARLDMPRQRQIEVILESFSTFDAAWAKALAASPDTIGRLLDTLKNESKARIKAPNRSRSGGRAARNVANKPAAAPIQALAPPTMLADAASPRDDGMADHADLWSQPE
ncbi:hypothetical protein [Sphingobium naphthae]|uniref:Uncharacterized protein n=1 Tax=Sphingobium naphthae TaxID=1886786 RepID=A0ABU4A254_9SPHN|nr:hypothetical protein [Sphingobium naphthae]MDV5825814.1 hypothetical protein [Sphingobium naphthae]